MERSSTAVMFTATKKTEVYLLVNEAPAPAGRQLHFLSFGKCWISRIQHHLGRSHISNQTSHSYRTQAQSTCRMWESQDDRPKRRQTITLLIKERSQTTLKMPHNLNYLLECLHLQNYPLQCKIPTTDVEKKCEIK